MAMFSTKHSIVLFVFIFALVNMEGETADAREVVSPSTAPTSKPLGTNVCRDDYGLCETNIYGDLKCLAMCNYNWRKSRHVNGKCSVPIGETRPHCYCYHECPSHKLTNLKLF
ncbi:hypothetical protein ABFX02_10G108700 [Erythranthe guttata]